MIARKVKHYLHRDGNELKIRVLEMQEADTSPLARIAEGVQYWLVDDAVDKAFGAAQPENHNIDPMIMHMFGMQDFPELRAYVNENIGDMTPEQFKPILKKQLSDLTYQNQSNFFYSLISHYARFNRLDRKYVTWNNVLRTDGDRVTHSLITTKSYPINTYHYINFRSALPSDPTKLLQFLGSLDGTRHSEDHHAPRHGFTVNHYYHDHAPETEIAEEMLHQSFSLNVDEPAKKELSVYVAEYIIAEYKKDMEGLAAYKDAVAELEALLATKEKSLTKLIRDKLYPDPTVEKFITEKCANEPIIANILDPKVSFTQASQDVITKLRAQLKAKPDKLTNDEIATETLNDVAVVEPVKQSKADEIDEIDEITEMDEAEAAQLIGIPLDRFFFRIVDDGNDDEDAAVELEIELDEDNKRTIRPKRTFNDPIHKEIADWFSKFSSLRKELWHQYVATLFGHPADDGGFYSSNYTEVSLMNESSMHLNKNGLMELDINKSKHSSYAENYAEGQLNTGILERELRVAFDLLGLHFLPEGEIDFHNGPVLFDAESTKELMNRGMHYSEDYCKKLMQSSHRHCFFTARENPAAIQLLPADVKSALSYFIDPDLHPTEDKAVRGMTIA